MTFHEFYRERYLPAHADPACRWLHLIGVPAVLLYLAVVIWLGRWWLLLLLPVPAYALGWFGHILAGNHPTFFTAPLYSFLGDWKLIGSLVVGRLPADRPPDVGG